MIYLFVHQNFPGQFLHIVRHLVAQNRHDVVFLSEPNANRIAGVRTFNYAVPESPASVWRDAVDFERATLRADVVRKAALSLKRLGFMPDVIIGHHGWGELLNLVDVWPGAPLLGYHEFYYGTSGTDVGFDPEFPVDPDAFPRIRAKNSVNLLALTNPGHGFTPTQFQLDTYPEWARPNITLLHEGVNLESCQPDPAVRTRPFSIGSATIQPHEKVVTYVARDLEPYRGFHTMMRAAPLIQAARPDTHLVLVGGDGVSYGAALAGTTWREYMLAQVGTGLDRSRIHFPGQVAYEAYLGLLKRSDAHVYLTYPFVASWSLREAMASGCAIIGSDTAPVREFLTHNRTGLLAPCLDPKAVARSVLEVLEDRALARRLGRAARRYAVENMAMDTYIAAFDALIERQIAVQNPGGARRPGQAKRRSRSAAAAMSASGPQ